jgi:hypothetical protein
VGESAPIDTEVEESSAARGKVVEPMTRVERKQRRQIGVNADQVADRAIAS